MNAANIETVTESLDAALATTDRQERFDLMNTAAHFYFKGDAVERFDEAAMALGRRLEDVADQLGLEIKQKFHPAIGSHGAAEWIDQPQED